MSTGAKLRRAAIAAPVLIGLALLLRLIAFNWDAGLDFSPHPDERHVVFMSEKIDGWFADPDFFAYGTLHFQAVRLVTYLGGMGPSWQALTLGSRILSLLASMVALMVAWWAANEAWGRRTANLCLGLAAAVPLLIQLSHFGTVEAHHAMWVMLCLAAVFQLARSHRSYWALISGAGLAASLAVKVSSLALVLPLVVALTLIGRRFGLQKAMGLTGAAGVAALSVFWLGQPWAFADARPPVVAILLAAVAWLLGSGDHLRIKRLIAGAALTLLTLCVANWCFALFGGSVATVTGRLNPAFVSGVNEQIGMVSGKVDMPYVRVYRGTTPLLYSARELALWGAGPAVVLVGLWGILLGGRTLGSRWRRLMAGRWSDSEILCALLLVWLVPTALRLATLQVKFLRYWEPLMLPMVMLGAWSVMRLRRRWRRRVAVAALAVTGLWGLSYVWAFADPHPFATAQSWLRQVVDRDEVVAWEHWDEHIGEITDHERVLASYDLPDDDAKVAGWCRSLAAADWVILTSHRVRRTVYRNPDIFPRTARLYRRLMAGESGFEVVTTVARGPRFFGFELPIQAADESFVNYEFPRVVALRKVQPVDPHELASRSAHPIAGRRPVDAMKVDHELLNRAPRVPPVPRARAQVAAVGAWLAVFFATALASWALLLPLLRGWPDGGLGLSIVFGWMAPAWLLWIASRLGLAVGPEVATAVLAGFVALGAASAWRCRGSVMRVLGHRRRSMQVVAVTFLTLFAVFLTVRLGNPAVYWGEKPMDSSFFNAFIHADSWPPGEPWMAGKPLHYYYFGDVMMAFPALATGADPAVAYNLACATVPALAGAPLMGLALLLARRNRRGLVWILPVGTLLMGNLAWPWLMDLARSARWFDLWWATSRVVPGYAITEYPLWTALFADLHAHWLALPLFVSSLMWAWITVSRRSISWVAAAAGCGVSMAALAATNPWDVLMVTSALAVATVAAADRPASGLLRLAAAAGFCVVFSLPFLVELVSWMGGGEGIAGRPIAFLTPADFAPWWSLLRHFGVFVVPLTAMAFVRPKRDYVTTAVLVVGGVALGLAFGSSSAALALALAMVFLTQFRWADDGWQTAAWSLAGLAMLAVAFAERVTLLDRMNTVFKLYNGAWILLALALATLLLRDRGLRWRVGAWTALPLFAVAVVNLPLGVLQGWVQPRMASPRPTLNGQAFLETEKASDAFLIGVLRGASRPGEVVAEAAGDAYGDFTRITMHTGLPSVVGWEWHLRQRGQAHQEILDRNEALEVLFRGFDPDRKREVLDRYGIRWVVVGEVERKAYRLGNRDPLSGVAGVQRWAAQGRSAVYRVLEVE